MEDKTAQINELLLKILYHSICVVVQGMFELGILTLNSIFRFNHNSI